MLYIYGVLLFSGNDPISELIKTVTSSRYSHCALALRDDATGKEFCFESTGSFHQLVWQQIRPQVQISSLAGTVDTYNGRVVLRKLRSITKTDVTAYVRNLIGTPYERNLGELASALTRSNANANDASLFCSELVAKTLIDNGYLPRTRLANNYIPKDFSRKDQNVALALRAEKTLRDDSCLCVIA